MALPDRPALAGRPQVFVEQQPEIVFVGAELTPIAQPAAVLQVDDERELPGHERTTIPDEDLWQIELEALDGSHFEVNSQLLVAAPR